MMTKCFLVTAVLAGVLASSPAHALEPRLQSLVTGDQVTLGDVFDGLSAHQDYVLAPAPAKGGRLVLNASDLTRISQAFDLGWQPKSRFDQAVIKRAPEPKADEETAAADAPRMIEVPVVTKRLKNGDVITQGDIEYVSLKSSEVGLNVVTNSASLIGQTPRHGLTEMKPIQTADVKAPTVVKKGQVVIMVLQTGVMSLTATGKALADAAQGETIRVMNTRSNQVIEGVVIGPQKIEIRMPSAVL